MHLSPTILCGVLGFFVCWIMIHLILRRSIWFGALNAERQFHQTHTTPIPRLGGIAIAAAFVAVSMVAFFFLVRDAYQDHELLAIAVCALGMFGVGVLDDIRPISAKKKFLLQILIASFACWQGVNIQSFKNPFTGTEYTLGLFGPPIAVFWLVAVTNLINLVDGIDGLAGGISFMVMCLLMYLGLRVNMSYTTLVAAGMAGALLGFLYFNFPPAKIYMGDGGAYLVGFLIGSLAIQSTNKGQVMMALLAPIFALAIPIIDVALAIFRRGVRGLPIFRPDRKHIHHRLQQLGLSPLRAVLLLYGLSLIFLLMGFAVFWTEGRMLPVVVGFSALIILLGVRSMGMIRDWITSHRSGGGAGAMRRNVRYALAMSRWLELSAERTQSSGELLGDFFFLAGKFGFAQVVIRQGGVESRWSRPGYVPGTGDLDDRHQIIADRTELEIEFVGESARNAPKIFFLLTELAAEACLRAVRRWQRTHKTPLQLAVAPAAASPGR